MYAPACSLCAPLCISLGEQVSFQVAAKTKARAGLLKDYVSDSFPKEEVERVLDSIADANNYIAFNVAPVERYEVKREMRRERGSTLCCGETGGKWRSERKRERGGGIESLQCVCRQRQGQDRQREEIERGGG